MFSGQYGQYLLDLNKWLATGIRKLLIKVHWLINDLGQNHVTALCCIISHFIIMASYHFKMQFPLWKLSYSHMNLERLAGEYVTLLALWLYSDFGFAGKMYEAFGQGALEEQCPVVCRIIELGEPLDLFLPKPLMLQRKLRYRGDVRAAHLYRHVFLRCVCCALSCARCSGKCTALVLSLPFRWRDKTAHVNI